MPHDTDVIFKKYFTDQQVAAVYGLTVGGLRNKIYAIQKNPKSAARLPKFTNVLARGRLWLKAEVRSHLMEIYKDGDVVDGLMARGEDVSPKPGGPRKRRKGKT